MKKKQKKYSPLKLVYIILIAPAFLWLTVSAPLVYSNQQKLTKQDKLVNACVPNTGNEEETNNSFGDTEGKIPAVSNSFSEQYLYANFSFKKGLQSLKNKNISTYKAFHDEIFVPPPNAL